MSQTTPQLRFKSDEGWREVGEVGAVAAAAGAVIVQKGSFV